MPNPPRNLQTRSASFELESVNEEGTFSGFLAVYGNVDSYGDRILPGAFKKSLRANGDAGRKFPILWQHDWGEPIGVFEKMRETDDGLYVERGRLLISDIPRARSARALMQAEAITGMSIGFDVAKARTAKDGVNELLELNLWEGSIVTVPANTEARIDAVKSALCEGGLPTLSQFEGFLREAGFTKTQAAAIAGGGLSKLLRSESGSEKAVPDGLSDALRSLHNIRF